MTPYLQVRIGNLVLPAGTVFELGHEREGFLVIARAPGLDPIPFGGEAAEAYHAFVEGMITCPVNANGVLDIAQGWKAQEATREFASMERVPVVLMQPSIPDAIATNTIPVPDVDPRVREVMGLPELRRGGVSTSEPPRGLPRIELGKVRERLGGI